MVHWTSPHLGLQYSIHPGKTTYYGVEIPAPPGLLSRLACGWLFGPLMGSNLQPQAPVTTPQYRLPASHLNARITSSRSTKKYETWYSFHLADDLRLKYLAPLTTDCLDRIVSPLDTLLSNPNLKNQDLVAPFDSFNPLWASLQSSALNTLNHPNEGESDLQKDVALILDAVVGIVSTLYARSNIKAPPGPLEVCTPIVGRHNKGNRQEAIHNYYLLRTSTSPMTSLTADYFVYLNHAKAASFLYDDRMAKHVLNDAMLSPGQIVLLGAEMKSEIRFERPNTKVAYPNRTCTKLHRHSKQNAYHTVDLQGFAYGNPEMADFDPARLSKLHQLLGIGDSQNEQQCHPAQEYGPLEQLWAQMVSQGVYVGFLMDWVHRNHVCVRDPTTGTLYISEPLSNPLNGTTFGDDKDSALALAEFISAMENQDFPWVPQPDRHSLLYVFGGAILSSLSLLHPDHPSPLFTPFSGSNSKRWELACGEMVDRRLTRHKTAQEQTSERLAESASNHSQSDKGPPPGGPSSGSGSNQGGPSPRGYHSTGHTSTANSHGSGHDRYTQTDQKHDTRRGYVEPVIIYLGIFDGVTYCSKQLEPFYNCNYIRHSRHDSPVPTRHSTRNAMRWVPNSDTSSSHSTSTTKSRTPSPIFERPFTPASMGSVPTEITAISQSPKSFRAAYADSIITEDSSLDVGKRDATQTDSNIVDTDGEHETATVILNSFVVEGAVGDVWQGYMTLPGSSRPVPIAAKLALTPQSMESLEHERYIYQHLGADPDLPIPKMYGYYRTVADDLGRQVGLLLMSWVDGIAPQTKDELRAHRPLIVDALDKLHRRAVVHGDIAPRNILVNEGKITLLDFDRAEVYGSISVDMNQLASICA